MNVKPLTTISRILTILLKVNIGLTAAAMAASFYSLYDYSHISPNKDVSEDLLFSDLVSGCLAVVRVVFAIFLGITFLKWIYRTNFNLRALSQEQMSFTPGWSVGWYFVPIANLFKPYQAMKEIWAIAHRRTPSYDSILGWWWFLWITSSILNRKSLKESLTADDARSYVNAAILDIASNAVDIILTIIAISLVTRIAKAYCRNFETPPAMPSETLASQF